MDSATPPIVDVVDEGDSSTKTTWDSFCPLQSAGHVGFDSLPDQLVNKVVQKGFVFNILSIGETGIGKSTLMDSLFNTTFEALPSPHNLTSVQLKSEAYELQENDVQMKLTLVETVGYGDQINKKDSFLAIVDYVDQQFEAYLEAELRIKRCLQNYHDTRVHACLYFICPTGHGLKPIDLVCMKKLENKVNIIPVIAKADTISKNELLKFKEKIVSELNANGVKIYQFPTDDESVAEINASMNSRVPFAVVGSSEFAKVGKKMVRARKYPWGTVQVENDNHCDFVKLRQMLIRTNMEDMRETTHGKHYELYRKTRLENMGFWDVDFDNNPISFQQTWKKKMEMQQQELAMKEEELKAKFIQRVREKEAELKEADRKLFAKFDEIKESYSKEKEKLEDYQKQIDDEIAEFGRLKIQHQTAQLSKPRNSFSFGSLLKGKKSKSP